MSSNWITYNDLAWIEDFLVSPTEYEDEVNKYIGLANKLSNKSLQSMLHLGCGAGGHDRYFKQHFSVTGVDLSKGMLTKAIAINPEIEYIEGDMRTLRLNRKFDFVAIPDSIDYMATLDDLRKAIETCVVHLKPGGIILIVAKTEEIFQNNNFAYEGFKDDVQVTLLENNFINPFCPNTYEATFIYLIRQQGKLNIHTESHTLGLFSLQTWEILFEEFDLKINKSTLSGLYDGNILGDGEYPLLIFVGLKKE